MVDLDFSVIVLPFVKAERVLLLSRLINAVLYGV